MLEVGILLMSPVVSTILFKVGRKNFIYIATISTSLASLGVGLLEFVENE